MKRLIFIIALFIFYTPSHAQTDFEIAKQLIGNNISSVDSVLTDLGLEYYITYKDKAEIELYIVKNNSIRVWNIKFHDIYTFTDNSRKVKNMFGENLVYEIFVRYRHSNLNDLKEFHAYDVPESTKYMTYDKNMGRNVSHLKVINERYAEIIDMIKG